MNAVIVRYLCKTLYPGQYGIARYVRGQRLGVPHYFFEQRRVPLHHQSEPFPGKAQLRGLEPCHVAARIQWMDDGPQTRVIFICPKCRAVFVAVQELRPNLQRGNFRCTFCMTLVHHWVGIYDYHDWKPVPPSGRIP
jgi:hypothetical protein